MLCAWAEKTEWAHAPGGRSLCVGSGKLTSSTLGRDSEMLKQACHCTRCSLGSLGQRPNVSGAGADVLKKNNNT